MEDYYICKNGNRIATIKAESKEEAQRVCEQQEGFTPTSVYTKEEWTAL